ncbi:MAG: YfcC family protein [Anaerolineae bacterium]|nr:YfcC family protein [Anaerolineae bacterium]
MEQQKAGAQIGLRAFLQALILLLILMILTGMLSFWIPAGSYVRVMQDGREVIDPDSFRLMDRPDYPFWRWFTAPFEVLASPSGLTIIAILVFLLMIGGAFAMLDGSGILKFVLARIVRQFEGRKYTLLMVVVLFFMLMGAFFGISEEVVPLVPVILGLSYLLGWDSLVGVGMSYLAVNIGFSAAITNPFTIGVAQRIAGLPAFSGAWLRVIVFVCFYALFSLFLVRYARKVEKHPELSPVYQEDRQARQKYQGFRLDEMPPQHLRADRAMVVFLVFLLVILIVLLGGPFVPAISDYALLLVGFLFLVAGVVSGYIAGGNWNALLKAAGQGVLGIAPGIPLILMAASIKHIAAQAGIMDTILHHAAGAIANASPFLALVLAFLLTLLLELFIGSATAKAFLVMPILLPLADLVGITRQLTVTAYCFGDGFANAAYPTNPVLLIVLGLTVISYPKWISWSLRLWVWVLLLSIVFLGVGLAVGFGPF